MRAATSTPCWPPPARRSPPGTDASLEDIAARRTSGSARFTATSPTREDLLEAVYGVRSRSSASRREAVSELEPWDAFEAWLAASPATSPPSSRCCGAQQGLGGLPGLQERDAASACRSSSAPGGRALRADVELDDVLRMVAGSVGSPYADDAQRERVLNIALDGLRAR